MPANHASDSRLRALIFAAGSDGDIHPHLGLASEIAARSHDVLFLTSFDYLDLARSCGLNALSIIDTREKDDFEGAKKLSPLKKIQSRANFFSRKVTTLCESVAEQLDECSILIAPPFACPIAKLLHLRYRVPYVSTVLSPASLCSLRNPPAFKSGEWFCNLPWPARRLLFRSLESLVIDPGFRWQLKDLLRSMNIPAPYRVMTQWSFSPQKILGLFAEWFCPRAEDWPAQLEFTGFPLFHPHTHGQQLPLDLKSFLDAGSPPVVFTAGTETKTARNFFEIALRTTETLGVRAVFLSRLADQLPALPASIHYAHYASLQSLLPRAAGIVHHGGIGTTAQAMRAGIPQLILPGRLDQFDNAQHVEALGCGMVEKNLRGSEGATEKLRQLLHSPQIANACRAAQDRVVPGSTACGRAADLIEEVWRSSRLPNQAHGSSI
jgi:rhamnosyltransferase subunit B